MRAFFTKNFKNKKENGINKAFLLLTVIVALIGTVTVYSAGYAYAEYRYGDNLYFAKRQTLWLICGLIIMVASSHIPLKRVKKLSPLAFLLTLILLGLTLIFGMVGNGAQRWISLGPVTFQPSEIAKLTLILILARYFSDKEELIEDRRDKRKTFVYATLIPFGIMLVPILLVMLQKHLSCIIILGTIGLIMIFLSGGGLKYLGGFIGMGALGVSYIALFTDYTKDRITVWQNPEAYKLTGGWQTLQGLMAIGSGGLFGKGFGKGELKYCYVSEPANDMIFAILCEESGLIGALTVILLFGILIYSGFKIGMKQKDSFARLTVLGISSKIAIQVLLNLGVVTNSIPNTGISLPFFSYGGSSLVMLFFEMGLILSASREIKEWK